MAARFTEVTLEDMVTFLNRAFHALHPHKGPSNRGEVTIDLDLSPNVCIRIFTSVGVGRNTGAQKGADAIRVGLFSSRANRPLIRGKLPIVKRTQNWRDNLRMRVEDAMEMYDEKEDYWESRA